jgi:hypothetical protein
MVLKSHYNFWMKFVIVHIAACSLFTRSWMAPDYTWTTWVSNSLLLLFL